MSPAVLAAEHRPLAEDPKTIQGGGAAGANQGIRQNPVVEGDVDAVVVPVKGHRLHIDIRMDQLGTADPDIGRGVQKLLRAGGEIDPQILDAVLIPAGVGDFSGVDGHGLLAAVAARRVPALVWHGKTSRMKIGQPGVSRGTQA